MKLATLTIITLWGLTFAAGAEPIATGNHQPYLAYEVPGTEYRGSEPPTLPENDEPARWDDTADTSDDLRFNLYDPEVKIPTHQETDLNNGVHDPLLEGYPVEPADDLSDQPERSPLQNVELPVPIEDPLP